MKRVIIFLILMLLSDVIFCQTDTIRSIPNFKFKTHEKNTLSVSDSIKNKIMNISKEDYPDNIEMQQYSYNTQISSYIYMVNVANLVIKEIVKKDYPNDYIMQKNEYDKLLSSKQY